MTDREKLVELLKQPFQNGKGISLEDMAVHLLLNGVTVQQWISVKDALPKLGERVLFSCGDFVGEAYLSKTGRWIRYGALDVEMMFDQKVTHWKPLPAPARKDKQGGM